MRIDKVTSDKDKVIIEIRENDNEFSELTTVWVNIENGVSISAQIKKKRVLLVKHGVVENRPLDKNKLNSLETELGNALKLLRELKNDKDSE